MATVDVIVRTKDRPVFLRRALGSIAGQAFTDFHVIIVNDGGDPQAVDEAVATSGLGDQVSVIHHAESAGRWPAANAAVEAGSAPLVVIHDDDDTWHPEFLDRAVAYLDAHPEAPGVVSRIEIIWEHRDGEDFAESGREIFQPHSPAPLLADLLLFNRFVPIGFLYRRSIHTEIGLYRDDMPVIGDWDFNIRVLSRWPLEYLGAEPLAYWHQRREARGADANSVIDSRSLHVLHDGLYRDAALRRDVSEHGLGAALASTKFTDRRFLDLEHYIGGRMDELGRRLTELDRRIGALEGSSSLATRVDELEQLVDQRTAEVARLVHVNRPGLYLRAIWRRLARKS